ncbi:alpha/beta fold hydrolase [Bailinhaonella thermotolerans]|uniref:Alpha/beta hydrolase n=1 Tax=Bailinhaonella thermotolerans TaxID=1070861 RepID=A0A3A4ATZ6_9ACTN|nr:alpha/beta hydrolase [Bailinhaonella thermotolerans]RJL30784.1 alpha/beta hydrolase [Bailinhaonella thermotolerans]
MDLAFERRGSGAPLVLLHGIGHHWQGFLPVMDRLAAARDVIAVDLPGFGASPPLTEGTPYTAETLADAVEAFCARLGVERPHVAGNSLGGYVALELAARGSAASATALSPTAFWSPPERVYLTTALRAIRRSARSMSPRTLSRLAATPAGRAAAFGLVVARPERLSPEAAAAATAALAEAIGFAPTLASFASMPPPAHPKAPVLIAWGDRDRLMPRRQAVRAARWLGQRVIRLRGCGHVPMSDDPELVARVLLDGSSHR